jgi:hypothetical protein
MPLTVTNLQGQMRRLSRAGPGRQARDKIAFDQGQDYRGDSESARNFAEARQLEELDSGSD